MSRFAYVNGYISHCDALCMLRIEAINLVTVFMRLFCSKRQDGRL